MSMKDIDKQLTLKWECCAEKISIKHSISKHLKKICQQLSAEYHKYLNVFDCSQISKLSSHCLYNHKIELMNDTASSQSWVYCMLLYKLQKIKKYLNKNLFKGFITLSKTVYFSSVLFTLKVNSDLWFCVNYWKLNALIKQNWYSLSLIEEVIEKIFKCKHLICLNIITVFNKLHMHSNSENLIMFITALNFYKYWVLLFRLINRLSIFQQYINDTLWDFLNDFCQTYLNDILVYSKIWKKHWIYIKQVLHCLCKADLQVNIKKCEFNISETVFLDIIVSDEELCINSQKVKAVIDWAKSMNLKEV